MRFHGYPEFLERRSDFDEAVAATPEIAGFCSSSSWQTAAFECLDPGRQGGRPLLVEDDGAWLAFVERPGTGIFFPLEALWMFGCPLVGEPEKAVALLEVVVERRIGGPAGFCIGGVLRDGRLYRLLEQFRDRALQWQEIPGTDCMEIDLAGGFEAWRERRSPKFRKTLRQLRVPEAIQRVDASRDEPAVILDRILAIQRQTYKWQEGADIFQGPGYIDFYRRLIEELHESGALRVFFALEGERDVAYQLGGRVGDTYRGLQMSYVEEARSWGVGNWLQLENLRECAEVGVTRYDLGMHAAYKERWADLRREFRVVFLVLQAS